MLNVTGQRPLNKATTPVPAPVTIVEFSLLGDPDSAVNNRESGKQAGSTVYVWDTGNEKYSQYIASGASPHDEWKAVGSGTKGISMSDTSHVQDRAGFFSNTITAAHVKDYNIIFHNNSTVRTVSLANVFAKDETVTGHYVRPGRSTSIFSSSGGASTITSAGSNSKIKTPDGSIVESFTLENNNYLKMTPDVINGERLWVIVQHGNGALPPEEFNTKEV